MKINSAINKDFRKLIVSALEILDSVCRGTRGLAARKSPGKRVARKFEACWLKRVDLRIEGSALAEVWAFYAERYSKHHSSAAYDYALSRCSFTCSVFDTPLEKVHSLLANSQFACVLLENVHGLKYCTSSYFQTSWDK